MSAIEVPASWEYFVEQFREGWSAPLADEFIARFKPLFDENAILTQPLAPTAVGHAGMERVFRALFTTIPQISTEIVRWGASSDSLFIEGVMTAKIGRHTVTVPHCDRFTMNPDGIVTERFAYFDPKPFVTAFLRSPSTWPRLIRAR
jgi:hypothetical protein